jgi:ABC-type Fe3+ transport system permease subunit
MESDVKSEWPAAKNMTTCCGVAWYQFGIDREIGMFKDVQAQRGHATDKRFFHRRRWWIYLSVFLCWTAVFAWNVIRPFRSTLPNGTASRREQELRGTESSPNPMIASSATGRVLISICGLFLGLVLGIGLAGLAECHDTRLRRAKDAEHLLSVSVVIGIPHLSVARERKRKQMLGWIERGAVAAMLLLILAGNLYFFLRR